MPPRTEYQGVFDCKDCICSIHLSPNLDAATRQWWFDGLALGDVCDTCDGGKSQC